MFRKISAFTLAEILITLTLIGVLAVILLPKVNTSMNVDAAKIKFRNSYIGLQKGLSVAEQFDNSGFTRIAGEDAEALLDNFVQRYFNAISVSRRDVTSSNSNIMATLSYDDDNWGTIDKIYKLPNGSHLIVPKQTLDKLKLDATEDDGCIESSDPMELCVMYLDVNGAQGPNRNMGTILDDVDGNDTTGACLPDENSTGTLLSEYSISNLNRYCHVPPGVVYDIYPVVFANNTIRPYSNAVMAILNNSANSEEVNGISIEDVEEELEQTQAQD